MSKKAHLTLAKTPAPKADRIHGSARNPRGSASSTTKEGKINLGKTTTEVLKGKLDAFKKQNPAKGNVTMGDLKAVYRRGSGAYSATHRPTITGGAPNSRAAWSYARVNKFLQKAAGKKVKKAYIQDDDLLKRGGQIDPEELDLIFYHEKEGNWFFPKNKMYVWLYDDLEAGKKLESGEYDSVLFPPNAGMYAAFQKGYIPPLKMVWTKKYQKDVRGSDRLVGIVEAYYNDAEGKLYILMMTTRKDYQRRGVNSYLVGFLRSQFNLGKEDVIFDNPTDEGKKFEASGKFEGGGDVGNTEMAKNIISQETDKIKCLECDGATRVFHYVLSKNGIKHRVMVGSVKISNDGIIPYHYWIELPDGNIIDYKSRMWLGESAEEGIFKPKKGRYIGRETKLDMNETLYQILTLQSGGGIGEMVKCKNCGWEWNTDDSAAADKYVCHKCGYAENYGRGGKTGERKPKASSGRLGDCYFVAGKIALNNKFKDNENREFIGTPYVVHAEVRGQGSLTGIRYGHAWVEDDLLVYDYSNNRTIVVPKQYYYMVGDIQTDDQKKYRRYTFEEARNKMDETGNYGCWDIEVDYANGGVTDKNDNMSKIQLPDMESDYETLEPILAKQGYELRRLLRATKSIEEIADEFNVPKYYVERELKRGTSVELEHTDREEVAREIALHHLAESPNYYINLAKMEAEQKPVAAEGGYYKRGGEINPDDSKIKNAVTHKAGSAGGLLVGNRHSEGGIKAINKSTGQPLEMEGGEVVITRNAVSDNQKREFDGEMLTNREILSRINEGGGGVSFAKGGDVPHKCNCTGREYRYGGKLMRDNDIVKNILDAYADMYDFAEGVVKQPLHYRRYGMGGTITYANNMIPTLRGFATAVGVPNVLMLRGRYAEYLKNDYNISFAELPHLLKSALLLGNQKLVDTYTKR